MSLPPKSFSYRFSKRLLDIVASASVLTLLSPILVLVAICIKLESEGPVFYRGLRTGQFDKKFRLLKFRTMVSNAEQVGGPSTGKSDPRITKVGKRLRKYKIDELPNLINVFLGHMSLVGPRPEVPQYTALYQGEEKYILEVPPGITDYSSIHFIALDEALGSENVDKVYEEVVRPQKNLLRVKYAKEASMLTDLKIIFLTLLKLIQK